MERLTMRDVGDRAFWVSPQSPGGGYRLSVDMEDQRRLDRLAAYEDAMPLERVQELAQAEKDGRLAVLPCRVGDTVYQTDGIKVYEFDVKKIVFNTDGAAFDDEAIGKTVFLTREEAETVLKKREDDNEAD